MRLVNASDIAVLLGVRRQTAAEWAERSEFPRPVGSVGRYAAPDRPSRVWDELEVRAWATRTGRSIARELAPE